MSGKKTNEKKAASSAPKRENLQQLELQRMFVSEQYLMGKSQGVIADLLLSEFGVKVSQQTISNDLKAVREEWKKRSAALINEHVAEEMAKIDHLERTYHALFEKSKGRRKMGRGDIKYLQRVEWCIDRRIQLLGVDAPKRTEISGLNGAPLKFEDVRERFIGRIASIVQRRGTAKDSRRSQ